MNYGKKYSPVFILGMPRSGTSLLRGLLSGHSEIAVPPRGEIQFFKDWNEKYGDLNIESNRNAFLSSFFEQKKLKFWEISEEEVKDKFLESDNLNYLSFHKSLMEVYQKHNKKKGWGDKSTSDIHYIKEILSFYPNAKFILKVRDPRDNYLSFKNAKWFKNTPKEKIKAWTNSEKWAEKWVNTYLEALSYFFTNSEQFYLQTHESLIYSFDQELSNLSNFLGISKEGFNLSIIDKPEQLAYSSSGQNIHGLDTRSIERWKVELDENDVKVIEDIGDVLMKLLGYQNVSSKNSNCLWRLKRNFKACVKNILHNRLNFYH